MKNQSINFANLVLNVESLGVANTPKPEWTCPDCGYEISAFSEEYWSQWPNSASDHLSDLKRKHLNYNCDSAYKAEYKDIVDSWKTGNKRDRILIPTEKRFIVVYKEDVPKRNFCEFIELQHTDWLRWLNIKAYMVIGFASYGHDSMFLLDNGDIVDNYQLLKLVTTKYSYNRVFKEIF